MGKKEKQAKNYWNRLSGTFYEIEQRDTTIFSRETGNFQYGINYAHTLWKPNWLWRINVLGGIGIEHWRLFETLPEYDNNDNRIPANAAVNNRLAPNVSNGLLWQTGIEVQRFVSAGSTWGIQMRYQSINHKPAGTAFFGGMWVVALQWSAFSFGSLSLRNVLRH